MGNYYQPFSLRVPEEILDKVKKIARYNKRSANKEIEFVLQEYISRWEQAHGEIADTTPQE